MVDHSNTVVNAGTVPITELVDVCEQMAATNAQLFELVGSWVSDEPDPARQQWFAVACHRHAWHAQLWSERRPKVPLDADSHADLTAPDGDRSRWYAEQIRSLQAALHALETSVDPTLDPSTKRVIQLVAADLADLAAANPQR